MKYYHYLSISDWGYGLFLINLLDSIDSDFFGDNKISIIYKKISYLLYEEDYDLLNNDFKKRFDYIKSKTKNYRKDLSKMFSTIRQDDLIYILKYDDENISIDNRFELFNFVYKVNFNIICNEIFIKKLIKENIIPLYFILQHEKLISSCSNFFHKYLLENPETLELFIAEIDIKNERKSRRYFPKFENSEINNWIEKYIEIKNCNLNYLRTICLHKDGDSYSLEPKTLVKVKQKLEEINRELSKNGILFSKNISVSIVENQEDPILYKQNGKIEEISFSYAWIDNNTDYPTLLNNLIYVVEICDQQMRINETYNKNNDGAIYSAIMTRHNKEYGSQPFQFIQSRRQLIFNSYISNLELYWKIKIEDIYKWFVEDYLKEEFNIDGMTLKFDFTSTDYVSKCRNVFTLIDRLLKQYSVYVDNGTFSKDLFKATKNKYKFDSVPSINTNKYYYVNSQTVLPYILFLLFSDQSMLNYINENLNEDNFVFLICKHKLKYTDFPKYDKNKIDILINNKIIIEKEEYLVFRNNYIPILLSQFYTKGFVNYKNLSKHEKDLINELFDCGFLCTSSKLFSTEEADFLSYYLNNEKFTNALALRNGYDHGDLDDLSDDEHKWNYYIGLRMLGIIIIKINDDLCQKFNSLEN